MSSLYELFIRALFEMSLSELYAGSFWDPVERSLGETSIWDLCLRVLLFDLKAVLCLRLHRYD